MATQSLDTSKIRDRARRYARITSSGIPDNHVNDLINEGIKQFAMDVYGLPTENYIDLAAKFDLRSNMALNLEIIGGTDALSATDITIGQSRDDTNGSQVATDLQTAIQAAGASNTTVAWDKYYLKISAPSNTTSIEVDEPTDSHYIDGTELWFGKASKETDTTWTGNFPPDCTMEASMPSDFFKIEYVEWDRRTLDPQPRPMFLSPGLTGTPMYYNVRGRKIKLYPVPTVQALFYIEYKEIPEEMTTFETAMPANIPNEFHNAIAYWVASELLKENHEDAQAIKRYADYWRMRNKYLVNYHNQITETSRRRQGLTYDVKSQSEAV